MQQKHIPSHRISDGVTANIPSQLKDVLVAGVNDEGKIMKRQYPHRHDYYEIMLLNDSEGIHHIDFTAYPFKGPAVFMLSPEQVHEVQDYAAKLHITPRQLNALVQKLTGKTAGTLIKERILLEAKRLLFTDTLSIKEIGYQIGFEDPAYFNRFFKKNMGMAPQQFREQAQQA